MIRLGDFKFRFGRFRAVGQIVQVLLLPVCQRRWSSGRTEALRNHGRHRRRECRHIRLVPRGTTILVVVLIGETERSSDTPSSPES